MHARAYVSFSLAVYLVSFRFSAVSARFPTQPVQEWDWRRHLLRAVPAPPAAITPLSSVSLLQTLPARQPLSVHLGHH